MTTLAELRRSVPFGLIFVVASSLVLAKVMMDTGTAKLIASSILNLASPWGAYGALVAVFLMTMVLTEMMTNNAAASLAFPIALGMAQHLGVNPRPFAMAVLYAASASFMTSFGYQTNLMVMGPGNYRETDYFKAGAPLSIAYAVTALLLIPKFFPF
jgi:di/tricarboxylate transporter